MADPSQVKLLREEGVEAWNASLERQGKPRYFDDGRYLQNPSKTQINLRDADLSGLDLEGIDLSYADLTRANLTETNLNRAVLRSAHLQSANLSACRAVSADFYCADLSFAELRSACFSEAHLWRANLWHAKCSGTNFTRANLSNADLLEAYLFSANFSHARLVSANFEYADLTLARLCHANLSKAVLDHADIHQTDLENSDLSYASLIKAMLYDSSICGAKVYGISVWDIDPSELLQRGLIITPDDQPTITVDDIEVAQFIYLILKNGKFRNVIDTITTKGVLILGRFRDDRKQVLDALKDALRERDYVPILFDFEPSDRRDLTETIQLMANLSKFIIADITEAKSIPQELSHIIPMLPSVPVQPILLSSRRDYAMFEHWRSFNSVLPEFLYEDKQHLLDNLDSQLIASVNAWHQKQDETAVLRKENKALQQKLRELSEKLTQQEGGV